jgi:hypothetical protein
VFAGQSEYTATEMLYGPSAFVLTAVIAYCPATLDVNVYHTSSAVVVHDGTESWMAPNVDPAIAGAPTVSTTAFAQSSLGEAGAGHEFGRQTDPMPRFEDPVGHRPAPVNVHAPLAKQHASPHGFVGVQEVPIPWPTEPLGHGAVPVVVHEPALGLQHAWPAHGAVTHVVFTPPNVLPTPQVPGPPTKHDAVALLQHDPEQNVAEHVVTSGVKMFGVTHCEATLSVHEPLCAQQMPTVSEDIVSANGPLTVGFEGCHVATLMMYCVPAVSVIVGYAAFGSVEGPAAPPVQSSSEHAIMLFPSAGQPLWMDRTVSWVIVTALHVVSV